MTTKQTARTAKTGKVARPKRVDIKVLRETFSELKKVVWPTREEATKLTTIVIIVSVAVGLALGLVDYGFFWIINTGLLGG